MALKFDRRYEFAIGDFKITNLRMRFSIEYSIGGFIPLCEIEFYNLNSSTINEVLKSGEEFSFRAGYSASLPVLFKGEIRNALTHREDVDVITTILSASLDKSNREKRISKTLDNPKSVLEIVNDFLMNVGIEVGEINIKEKKVLGSYTVSDTFINAMNKISKAYEFIWFIYNDLFYAFDQNLFPNRAIHRISTFNGLLETPILTEKGINLKMLLEPDIRPQDRFEVISENLQVEQNSLAFSQVRSSPRGIQYATSVKHSGDTHSDAWYTEITGVKLSGS